MPYHDRSAEPRAGKGTPPSLAGGGKKVDKKVDQETDKTYGAGRFSQRTPETPQGTLAKGDHRHAHSPERHGHGRDYNGGSDEQRHISPPHEKSD